MYPSTQNYTTHILLVSLSVRSLSMIYKELEKRTTEDLSVHISYLELYQDVGYDLLNPGARTQSYVTPFPKVRPEFFICLTVPPYPIFPKVK